MTGSMFSADWYRVASLKPRLRGHVEIHRQRFRGSLWYVMQDPQGGRFHRLSPAAHLMLCLMDGRRTMQTIWEMLGSRLRSTPPTQDDCIALLAQLHGGDLIVCDVTPDLAELEERSRKMRHRRLMSRVRNPLAVQIPLIDPDRFLERSVWLARWMFSGVGLAVWLALVGLGCALALTHWTRLTGDMLDQVFTSHNAFLMVLTYPFVKALHELGHGYAVKRWGGEVHEMGVMILVLMPVPYVDASSSLAFHSKWQRAAVGAAGIMVELALAALAMIVWVNVEQGWISAILFNVMLIGGVSTLFFNGNPLLRFDGYYVLSDLVEIPNLATRANRYFLSLVQQYLLGIERQDDDAASAGERAWLLGYAVAAFVYRLFIMVSIALFVATKLFFVGVVLALWSLAHTVLMPLLRGLRFLLFDQRLRRRRKRAVGVVAGIAGCLGALIFAVPLPYATISEGVVWAPENTQIRSRADGQIVRLMTLSDAAVQQNNPLAAIDNPELLSRLKMLEAQRLELEAQLEARLVTDRVQTRMIRAQIDHVERALASAREEVDGLVVRAPAEGRLVLPNGQDLVGRFVLKGQQIGLVVRPERPIIRVVLPQEDVDLVRHRTQRIKVRLANDFETTFDGSLTASTPAAVAKLPSGALGSQGGGRILTDPADRSGVTPLETIFQFDVRLDEVNADARPGLRAFVRFDHGREAIGWRLIRSVRQVFLSVLNV